MKAYLSILQILGATEEEFISIAADEQKESDFKKYQDIMEDYNEAEKKFLLDTLENLKENLRVLMCDNRPIDI